MRKPTVKQIGLNTWRVGRCAVVIRRDAGCFEVAGNAPGEMAELATLDAAVAVAMSWCGWRPDPMTATVGECVAHTNAVVAANIQRRARAAAAR